MFNSNEFKSAFKTIGFLLILVGLGLFGIGYAVGYLVFN